MFEEYIDSLILSIGDNKNKVLIDIRLVTNQKLEKINAEVDMLTYVIEKFIRICNKVKVKGYNIKYKVSSELYTIADYRRGVQ